MLIRDSFKSIILVLCLLLLGGCSAMKSFSRTLGFREIYTEIMIEAEPEEVEIAEVIR